MIRKCITTFYSYIAELIYHLKGNHVYEVWDNRTKMSSLSIIRNKKYNNFPISKLDIDRDIIQRLYANNIYSLYDLLSYSQYDFCRKPLIIGKHCFKQIKEVIHSLGLKFITELSDDEKRLIIVFCSEDVINNSSLSWIIFLDKSLIQRMNVDIDNPITIGNLKKYQSIDILCYRQANFKAINYATSIGINISGYKVKKDITQNNYVQYMSLMDVLNIKIEEIEMSINLYYKLKNLGINIIKDIICHSLEDFYFDENSQDLEQELANIISYLGLSFANDSTILNDYLKEISFQLSPPKSISIPEEEIIVRQYQSLVGQSNRLPSDIRENGFEKIYTETGYEKRIFRNFQN
ncbi:MAG: hypothetical protein IJR82_03730 [Bacilli bacterium]|nr:hypothetical protein [Bacilli bacterium]